MSVGSLNVPPAKTIPLLNVEVAPEERLIEPPEMVRPFDEESPPPETEMPPAVKVEVAEPVTLKLPTSAVPVAKNPLAVVVPAKSALPWTEKSWAGEVVPTPTKPVVLLMNRSSVFIEKFPVVVKLVEAPSKAMSVSAIRRDVVFRSRVVPASNVNVPEVYESDASERRKERESIVSNVVASPPELDRQVPEGIWKQPAERAMPLLKEEVALEVRRIFPPEIVRPDDVAKNPGAVKPEYIVEVPPMKFPTPWTEKIEPGVEVPMPMLPPK
ncbi:hypothetical protein A3E06_04445 [Candidatus Giovannonibacteria bacterium RIFCSPHIGHO2_12_FULL_44_42]|nr:MAG: hypothetical protein A3E06_04445 [Candidatus Giovannonibacteria bacterium RIFCSPHIGHO2_12_FULL_44_42]